MSAGDATARAHVAQRGSPAVAQRSAPAAGPVAQPLRSGARVRHVAPLGWVLALALGGGLACRSGETPLGGGDSGAPPDATPKLCATSTACEDTKVHACRDGRLAEVIEECGPDLTCSRGRCTSTACALTERSPRAVQGCSFFTLRLDNVDTDDDLPSSLLVTNPGGLPATATLEHRLGGRWTELSKVAVPPMRAARLALPQAHYEGGGFAAQSALRLVSDLPVTVVDVQSDDSGPQAARSAGATMLLPEHVLGRRYRAIAYPQLATSAVIGDKSGRDGAGQLVIVGTQDHTTVTVTPPLNAMLGPAGGAPATGPDRVFTLSLAEGDYQQIYTSHDGADLTGTEIVADKPVAVFSGNISTTYGEAGPGINSADLAHEQLLPVAAWGSTFVAAALPPRPGLCDSLYDGPMTSIWRIVADQPNTTVDFLPPPGVTGPFAQRILRAGEPLRLFVPAEVSFTIKTSAPIEIMQGMDCEATLASAVPVDPLLGELWFAVLPTFDSALAVVRKEQQAVFLDEGRVDEAAFAPAGGGFEVAELPLAACPAREVVCAHHLAGQFGVTMRGQDVLTSWALTVPTWRPCTDPDAKACAF
jgi:hypothetical protein